MRRRGPIVLPRPPVKVAPDRPAAARPVRLPRAVAAFAVPSRARSPVSCAGLRAVFVAAFGAVSRRLRRLELGASRCARRCWSSAAFAGGASVSGSVPPPRRSRRASAGVAPRCSTARLGRRSVGRLGRSAGGSALTRRLDGAARPRSSMRGVGTSAAASGRCPAGRAARRPRTAGSTRRRRRSASRSRRASGSARARSQRDGGPPAPRPWPSLPTTIASGPRRSAWAAVSGASASAPAIRRPRTEGRRARPAGRRPGPAGGARPRRRTP